VSHVQHTGALVLVSHVQHTGALLGPRSLLRPAGGAAARVHHPFIVMHIWAWAGRTVQHARTYVRAGLFCCALRARACAHLVQQVARQAGQHCAVAGVNLGDGVTRQLLARGQWPQGGLQVFQDLRTNKRMVSKDWTKSTGQSPRTGRRRKRVQGAEGGSAKGFAPQGCITKVARWCRPVGSCCPFACSSCACAA